MHLFSGRRKYIKFKVYFSRSFFSLFPILQVTEKCFVPHILTATMIKLRRLFRLILECLQDVSSTSSIFWQPTFLSSVEWTDWLCASVYSRHLKLKPFCGPNNDRKTVSGPQFRNIIISFLWTHSFISKFTKLLRANS